MNPNALWGATFACLATILVISLISTLAGGGVGSAPIDLSGSTTGASLQPSLASLLTTQAIDMMFLVAYGAAFVAIPTVWRTPARLPFALLAAAAGVAGAALDALENINTFHALSHSVDPAAVVAMRDILPVNPWKWTAIAIAILATSFAIPMRGLLRTAYLLAFPIIFVPSALTMAWGARIAPDTASIAMALTLAVVPFGMLGLAMIFLSEARRMPAHEIIA